MAQEASWPLAAILYDKRMATDPTFLEYILTQLRRFAPIRAQKMFGGIGFYTDELFFALIANDTLFFKVDATTRPKYEAQSMARFSQQYYAVPEEVLDDPDQLRLWMDEATHIARTQQQAKANKSHRRRAQPGDAP